MRRLPVPPLCNHLGWFSFAICIGKLFILLNPAPSSSLKEVNFVRAGRPGADFYIFTVDVAFQAKDIGLPRLRVFSSYRGLFADIGDAFIVRRRPPAPVYDT